MILHQLDLGTTFDYIGADGFYGNDCNLARKIDHLGLTYMLDIHSNQLVYLEKPELVLPERKDNRGPKPKRLISQGVSSPKLCFEKMITFVM